MPKTARTVRVTLIALLPAAALAGGCAHTVSERDTVTLAPGSTINWTLQGTDIHFNAKNEGPADVALNNIDGDGVTIVANGSYEVDMDIDGEPVLRTVSITNTDPTRDAKIRWSYKSNEGSIDLTEE
jgi:hypothetical protein